LDKDFHELSDRHGYDFIELQLDFSMDLYPFYPPLVKVSLAFERRKREI
jgi:hypothetical protein